MRTTYAAPSIDIFVTSPSGDIFTFNNTEMGGDILTFTCQTSLRDPMSSSFEFTVVPKRIPSCYLHSQTSILVSTQKKWTWFDVFAPRTKVDCYLNGIEVFLGIASDVNISTDAGNGRVDITVSGLSIAAVLAQFGLIWHRVGGKPPVWAVTYTNENQMVWKVGQVSPSEIMEKNFEGWMGFLHTGISGTGLGLPRFRFADGTPIENSLIVKRSSNNGLLSDVLYAKPINYRKDAFVYEGDFWTYFGECFSPTFNELWCDCGDRNVRLYSPSTIQLPGKNYQASAQATFDFPGDRYHFERLTDKVANQHLFPGKCYVVLRPTPWDDLEGAGVNGFYSPDTATGQASFVTVQDYLDELKNPILTPTFRNAVALTDEEVFSTNLFRSDAGVYTAFQVMLQGTEMVMPGSTYPTPPIYDEELTAMYGHRPLFVQLKGTDLTKAKIEYDPNKGAFNHYTQSFERKLQDWFKWQDHFLSGTLTTYLNPFIRIGQWLWYGPALNDIPLTPLIYQQGVLRTEQRYYYVNAVKHTYNYEKHMTETTVTVERGTPLGGFPPRRLPESSTEGLSSPSLAIYDRVKAIQRQREVQRKVGNLL